MQMLKKLCLRVIPAEKLIPSSFVICLENLEDASFQAVLWKNWRENMGPLGESTGLGEDLAMSLGSLRHRSRQ